MKSMIDLQIAVLNEDQNEIHSILNELDRKTESEMFAKAARHFGFKTLEHHGRRFVMRRHLAPVFGYIDESGLRKLCERHDLETVSLGAFGQNVRDLAVQELGLSRNDGKSIFVGWDAFLLAGMESTTDAAKQVKLYLLQMERAGRVAGGALDAVKARANRINEADKISLIASRIDRMQNNTFRQQVAELLDEVLDGALGVAKQSRLFGPTGCSSEEMTNSTK